MGDSDASTSMFDQVIGDMKTMAPLWEDLLMKASKFHSVVKQTALAGDAFLDSFQKVADAVTNSKGATRDIGVSFTKIVMRHRAVENKLKIFVAIFADNFITPLQDSLDEWKKNCNQLEKEHTKDYKRVKGDLKKSVTDTSKLKKKVTKKVGSKEYYTEQFRESVKLSTSLQKTLEEQEKSYIRKVMVEERTRATQFFHYYKPCMEQQLALLADIEQLQSILEETTAQCESPYLPSIYEEVINEYKLPDHLNFSGRKESNSSTPPASPFGEHVRHTSLSCPPTHTKIPLLRRSLTTNSFYRNGVDPIPVSIPLSPSSVCHETISSSSFSSSSSSVDQDNQPMYDTVNTTDDFEIDNSSPPLNTSGTNESYLVQQISNQGGNRPPRAHTSCSSIATSDSSGIGSYNSLNSHNRSSNLSGWLSRACSTNESDPLESDMNADYQNLDMLRLNSSSFHQGGVANSNPGKYATIDRSHFRRNKSQTSVIGITNGMKQQRSNSIGAGESAFTSHEYKTTQQNGQKVNDHKTSYDLALYNHQKAAEQRYPVVNNKYATIDRSHLRRNQIQMAATLKELELKQRLSDVVQTDLDDDPYPNFPDYKMNLPKSKANTVGRQNMYTSAKKPTIFQIFDGQNMGQNVSSALKQLSPTSSPQTQSQTSARQVVHPAVPLKPERVFLNKNTFNSSPQLDQQTPLPENHSSPKHFANLSYSSGETPPNIQSSEPPATKPKPQNNVFLQRSHSFQPNHYTPKQHTEFNEPEPAKPGSFEAALQERRSSVLKKTLQ